MDVGKAQVRLVRAITVLQCLWGLAQSLAGSSCCSLFPEWHFLQTEVVCPPCARAARAYMHRHSMILVFAPLDFPSFSSVNVSSHICAEINTQGFQT